MSATTIIMTATPARFAALTAASGIGIAPATAAFGLRVAEGRAAGFSGHSAEIVPFRFVGTGVRRRA